MCTRYPIINRVSELKVHIELTRFVQPEKIEIDANERAVNEKSQYCFFVCTTFDSFLNDLSRSAFHRSRVRAYVAGPSSEFVREITASGLRSGFTTQATDYYYGMVTNLSSDAFTIKSFSITF